MTPFYADEWLTLYGGDCRDVLREMEPESVNCVVTSPPYWGLRDYGVAGQLGLEPTPEEYVAAMVDVFREVRRVLRSDGTLWLNLGDSYATGGGAVGRAPGGGDQGARFIRAGMINTQPNRMPLPGLKSKDLVGIPWRVAFALQADGWYLRSDIIWSKPNPMPESVTDRPTKSHEYLFLLTKSARYHFDADAVRTPLIAPTRKMPDGWATHEGGHGSFHRDGREKGRRTDKQRGHGRRHAGFNDRWDAMKRDEQVSSGANIRSVWTVATAPYPGAHFATFPPKLVEPCIKAGCPEGGTVMDPFGGTGTVGMVAASISRRAVLIDLNPDYLRQCLARNAQTPLGLGA